MARVRAEEVRAATEKIKPGTIHPRDTEACQATEGLEPGTWGEQAATAQNERSDHVNKLVLEIQNGDTDLLPILWEAVENFIRFQASRRLRVMIANDAEPLRGNELDDYVQQGYFALLDAIERYNPDKETKFTTYFSYHLKRAFNQVDGISSTKRDGLHKANSLNEQIFDDEPDGGERIDLVPDPGAEDDFREAEERIFIEELHRALERAVDALSQQKREIIKGKYFDGLKRAEIAKKCGMTEGAVAEAERSAFRDIRRKITVFGLDKFVEENTPFYRHYSVDYMQRTQTSPIEAIVQERERLRALWWKESKDNDIQ